MTRELQREIASLFGHITRTDRAVADETPLTATQRLALAALFDGGPVRLHELAARIGATPPTASRAVDALVTAGLVERVADPRDRRALQIDVTPRGRRRVERRRAEVARTLEPALDRMRRTDRERLVTLIRRLNAELASPLAEAGRRATRARRAA